MNFKLNLAFFTLIVLNSIIKPANGIRTKDKMYDTIDASKACFRRLNATHQIGCTSKRGGSTGAIHFCETQFDLEFIVKNGTAPPYIPVIPTTLFTPANLNLLKSSEKISGLLLHAGAERPSSFSHEHQCPNPQSSLQGTCQVDRPWNPYGTGLLYQDIPFPIFYVENPTNLAFARACFDKHNNFSFETQRDRSLCSLQMLSFMYATKDSPTCIRRSNLVTNLNPPKFCDPLGDRNVWSSLFPLATDNAKPIAFKHIIVAARMDTTSMFEKTAGAIAPVTGLVALLSTAQFLKALLPRNNNYTRNVLFVLFNGESYDYLGSQRFVYELLKGNFPVKSGAVLPNISMSDIELFVELSQLNRTGKVVAHYLEPNEAKQFNLNLQKEANYLNLDFTVSKGTLPPSSLHSFLKNQSNLPSLVLADHEKQYNNAFYNSIYDNATGLAYRYANKSEIDNDSVQKHIQNVSTMLAKALYSEITGKNYQGEEKPDLELIDELFHCYLEDANCQVHQAVQQIKWQKEPFSLYVGVEIAANLITSLIGLSLAWVTGDKMGPAGGNCTNEPRNYAFRYFNMSESLDDLNMTVCIRVTMNFTEAVSPAFVIPDYDWSSGEYSSWTESTWGDIKLRIFLKPSAAHENMTIAIGSIVFVFSLIFVYFVKSRSDMLFAPQLPTLAPTNC